MTKDNAKNQGQQGQNQQGGQDVDGLKRHPVDQGGHDHLGGHGGQQSGGMGGMHGGDLHDIGSGQSGMTGGAGMGGNPTNTGAPDSIAQEGNEQLAEAGGHEIAEVQQSAQREGMGQHRLRNRGNQDIDATDADDLGSRDRGAADSQSDDKTGAP